jgi:two-component system chemotaxis sensor kinase CheA
VSEIDSVAEPLEMLFSTIRQSFRFALEETEGDTQKKLIESQEAVEQAIEHVTAKLSEMRLVHAGQILERAARAGRAAAMACGKVVSIEIVGKDVLIDRIAASALSDSLVHLVRNAVDHGIESPEERSNLGKPLPATVRIEAECDQSAVYFRVLDNGRGIDAEAVKVAATALGYSAANDALALEGCLQLIFQPGVSTKESTSETSGRGVGLDVVRQSVASIGGEVRVKTDPGKGSCFEIRILNNPDMKSGGSR